MIYLIDDKFSTHNLNLSEFDEFIKVYQGIRLPDYRKIKQSTLSKAEAILLHDTLPDLDINGSVKKSLDIREDIENVAKKKIPLVLFSGGIEETTDMMKDHNRLRMRRVEFYANLPLFLQYMVRGHKDFSILAGGKACISDRIDALSNDLLNNRAASEKFNELLQEYHWLTLTILSFNEFADSFKGLSNAAFSKELAEIKEAYLQYGENILYRKS